VGTSLPFLLAPGMHHLEAWDEAVAGGAWGGLAARVAESLRQALDLEHWAAFDRSFRRLTAILTEVASGRRGRPPVSIVLLSGDVHHAYLCEVAFRPEAGVRSAVYQAVCSPYRNPLDAKERQVIRAGFSRPFAAAARGLARLSGAPDPGIRWRLLEGPYFDNQVATLRLDGRKAIARLDKTVADDDEEQALEKTFERRIA